MGQKGRLSLGLGAGEEHSSPEQELHHSDNPPKGFYLRLSENRHGNACFTHPVLMWIPALKQNMEQSPQAEQHLEVSCFKDSTRFGVSSPVCHARGRELSELGGHGKIKTPILITNGEDVIK